MLAERSGPESTCRAERMRAGIMVGVWPGQDGVGGLSGSGWDGVVARRMDEMEGVVQVCLSCLLVVGVVVRSVLRSVVKGGCEVGWLESGVDGDGDVGCRRVVVSRGSR